MQRGSGVCAFVKFTISFTLRPDLCCTNHKSLWLRIRPFRLPREFSCIFVGVIYHPPSADSNKLYDCLINSLEKILARYPLGGVIIMGDFNQFDTKHLCRNTVLKKIEKNLLEETQFRFNLYSHETLVQCTCTLVHEILLAIGQSDHKPWITPDLKLLISQRQKALALGNWSETATKLFERSNNPKLDFMNHK